MKKYVKWTIGLTAGILVLIMSFMIVIDPLYQYHLPWLGLKTIVTNNEQYYVPGMAKNFEYTNAIVGTSMSENFRVSWFDENFDGETEKLTISGIRPKEYYQVLDIVLNHKGTKRVIMNIDTSFLLSEPNQGEWDDLPDYLYDDCFFNDCNYFYNKTIWNDFARMMIKNQNLDSDYDDLFTWDGDYSFSKIEVLKRIKDHYEEVSEDELVALSINFDNNVHSMNQYFQDNQNIEFVVFFAPFSIGYWYTQREMGMLDLMEKQLLNWYSTAIDNNNVKMYFFFDDDWREIITNLDNYKDLTHYSSDINKMIIDKISEEQSLLDKNNYESVITSFFAFVRTYNYDLMY